MQRLNVVLYALNQLCLILTNGTPDVRSHEQRIETRENAKHLVGILGGSQLIAQMRRNACLDTVCKSKKLNNQI